MTFRPPSELYQRMVNENERTGVTFQKMIEKALESYLPPAKRGKAKRATRPR